MRATSCLALALTLLTGAGCGATALPPTEMPTATPRPTSSPTPRPTATHSKAAPLPIEPASPTPSPAKTATRPRPSPTPAVEVTGPMNKLIETAKTDLSQRLGIPAKQISVVEAKAVEWPNTSLGCPQPGMMYAEVITPGYLIVLSVEDKSYDYHSDGQRTFLCEKK